MIWEVPLQAACCIWGALAFTLWARKTVPLYSVKRGTANHEEDLKTTRKGLEVVFLVQTTPPPFLQSPLGTCLKAFPCPLYNLFAIDCAMFFNGARHLFWLAWGWMSHEAREKKLKSQGLRQQRWRSRPRWDTSNTDFHTDLQKATIFHQLLRPQLTVFWKWETKGSMAFFFSQCPMFSRNMSIEQFQALHILHKMERNYVMIFICIQSTLTKNGKDIEVSSPSHGPKEPVN